MDFRPPANQPTSQPDRCSQSDARWKGDPRLPAYCEKQLKLSMHCIWHLTTNKATALVLRRRGVLSSGRQTTGWQLRTATTCDRSLRRRASCSPSLFKPLPRWFQSYNFQPHASHAAL